VTLRLRDSRNRVTKLQLSFSYVSEAEMRSSEWSRVSWSSKKKWRPRTSTLVIRDRDRKHGSHRCGLNFEEKGASVTPLPLLSHHLLPFSSYLFLPPSRPKNLFRRGRKNKSTHYHLCTICYTYLHTCIPINCKRVRAHCVATFPLSLPSSKPGRREWEWEDEE
jgi:hypothetical protein